MEMRPTEHMEASPSTQNSHCFCRNVDKQSIRYVCFRLTLSLIHSMSPSLPHTLRKDVRSDEVTNALFLLQNKHRQTLQCLFLSVHTI